MILLPPSSTLFPTRRSSDLILIVGAAVGFGGKLMRTVSFLGCTFAASAGFGGTAPGAGFGIFSAISFFRGQTRGGAHECQMLIRALSCAGRILKPPKVRCKRAPVVRSWKAPPTRSLERLRYVAHAFQRAGATRGPVRWKPSKSKRRSGRAETVERSVCNLHSIAFATAAIPATTETASSASSSAARTRRPFFARPGDVNRKLAALEFLVVKHFDGLVGLLRRGILDEGEAAGFAGEFV